MTITFIGDSTCFPDVGREMSCFLINGRHLVDTGWCAVLKMREYGFDPLALESVFISHFHQDHYIGLPQLLFYTGLGNRRKKNPVPLKIIGPSQHLASILKTVKGFLQVERFPEIEDDCLLVPITAGDRVDLPDLHIETLAANHVSGHQRPEQALVYRFTEKGSGRSVVFTGDTHYHPPIAEFARGASLLIHDAAHTSARDAASIARAAGVGRLLLTHYRQEHGNRLLAEARAVFPATDLARAGIAIEV